MGTGKESNEFGCVTIQLTRSPIRLCNILMISPPPPHPPPPSSVVSFSLPFTFCWRRMISLSATTPPPQKAVNKAKQLCVQWLHLLKFCFTGHFILISLLCSNRVTMKHEKFGDFFSFFFFFTFANSQFCLFLGENFFLRCQFQMTVNCNGNFSSFFRFSFRCHSITKKRHVMLMHTDSPRTFHWIPTNS